MLQLIIFLSLASAQEVPHNKDADLHGRPTNAVDFRGNWKGGGDGVSGEQQLNRMLNMGEPVKERDQVKLKMKPITGQEYTSPAEQLARYNGTSRTGNGAVQNEEGKAATCVPNYATNRKPAAKPAVQGFKCTEIHPASGLAKAGLLNGDVILSVDGKKVNTPQAAAKFVKVIEYLEFDKVVVVRDGREEILAAPLR